MRRNMRSTAAQLPRAAFWLTFHALSRIPTLRVSSRKALVRGWYELVSLFDRAGNVTFLNYGYAHLDDSQGGIQLSPHQEQNRYCIQLYERVVDSVKLAGKDVLEVGCGRGGGSNFTKHHFMPRTVIGLDFADKAIQFCLQRYHSEGLSYVRGDAEDMPFPTSYFDAVLNVESSHNYPNMSQFLREVHRVLRPQGYLLFADHRPAEDIELLRDQLSQSGLILRDEEHIAPNVVRALELDSTRRLEQIRRRVPKFLRRTVQEFSGVTGSELYEKLRTGELDYRRFVLQKP